MRSSDIENEGLDDQQKLEAKQAEDGKNCDVL